MSQGNDQQTHQVLMCSNNESQSSGTLQKTQRGRRRRRKDVFGALWNEMERTTNSEAVVVAAKDAVHDKPSSGSSRNNNPSKRFLWTATGLYLIAVLFVSIHAVGNTLANRNNNHADAPAVSFNLRHRRLNQEREHDEHFSSYAQRHYNGRNHYSSTSTHYYSGNGYGFMEDEDDIHRRYRTTQTNLSDVWLCLLTTLGCVSSVREFFCLLGRFVWHIRLKGLFSHLYLQILLQHTQLDDMVDQFH